MSGRLVFHTKPCFGSLGSKSGFIEADLHLSIVAAYLFKSTVEEEVVLREEMLWLLIAACDLCRDITVRDNLRRRLSPDITFAALSRLRSFYIGQTPDKLPQILCFLDF